MLDCTTLLPYSSTDKGWVHIYVQQYSCTPLVLLGEPRCLSSDSVYSLCIVKSFRYRRILGMKDQLPLHGLSVVLGKYNSYTYTGTCNGIVLKGICVCLVVSQQDNQFLTTRLRNTWVLWVCVHALRLSIMIGKQQPASTSCYWI